MVEITSICKKVLPRLLKAAFWGFLMGGEAILFLRIVGLSDYIGSILPIDELYFFGFIIVFMLFEVAIQFLSDTIFKYALSIARATISMIYLVITTNGGILTITLPHEMAPFGVEGIGFTIEFRSILLVFLTLSLISVVKNIFQAITFLSERAEEPIILAKIP